MIRVLASEEAGAKLARRGLVSFCVVSLIGMQWWWMRAEREDRREDRLAIVAAIRDQLEDTGSRLDRIAEALGARRTWEASIEGAIRGRCPECRPPRCPECRPPPCPECRIEVPPPVPAPTSGPSVPYRGAPTLIVGPAPLAR